jgi:hypothetical protein
VQKTFISRHLVVSGIFRSSECGGGKQPMPSAQGSLVAELIHQAETALGWRIRRTGDLLKINGGIRIVNATKFLKALK